MRTYYPTLIRPPSDVVVEWALSRDITDLSDDTNDWDVWVYRMDNAYGDYVLCLNTTDRRIAVRCDNMGYPDGYFISDYLGNEDKTLIAHLIEEPATIGVIDADTFALTAKQWRKMHERFPDDQIDAFCVKSKAIDFETNELCCDKVIAFNIGSDYLLMDLGPGEDDEDIVYATISQVTEYCTITSFDDLLNSMGCSDDVVDGLQSVVVADPSDTTKEAAPTSNPVTANQINELASLALNTTTDANGIVHPTLTGPVWVPTSNTTDTTTLTAPRVSVRKGQRTTNLTAAKVLSADYRRPNLEQATLYHSDGWWVWSGNFGEEKSHTAMVAYSPDSGDWVSFFCDDNGSAQVLWGIHETEDLAVESLTKVVAA